MNDIIKLTNFIKQRKITEKQHEVAKTFTQKEGGAEFTKDIHELDKESTRHS